MSHHHHHHHHRQHAHDGGDSRLLISIALNALQTLVEFIGGLLSGSLALLSDALHNLSDTTSLGISYVARRISRRDANSRKTFGYRRAEIIGAFINLITLVLIALFLMKEAVERFFNPQAIDGMLMLVVAAVGFFTNLISAALLFRDARNNLNIRSAFLHIFTDGVSSLAVIAGGVMIVLYDFYLIDPVLTLAISVYLLIHSWHMLRQTVDILMESTPRDVDLIKLVDGVRSIDGVRDVHHIHVWQLDELQRAMEAHVVISDEDLGRMEEIKSSVKRYLQEDHQISHSTLEFESEPCDDHSHGDCYEHTEATLTRRGA